VCVLPGRVECVGSSELDRALERERERVEHERERDLVGDLVPLEAERALVLRERERLGEWEVQCEREGERTRASSVGACCCCCCCWILGAGERGVCAGDATAGERVPSDALPF